MKNIRLGTYLGKDGTIRKVTWIGLDFGSGSSGYLESFNAVKYETETSPGAKTIRESTFRIWADKIIKEAGTP